MVSDKGTMVIWEYAPATNISCQGVGYAQERPYILDNAARSFAVASLCSTSSIVKCLSGSTIFSPDASTNTRQRDCLQMTRHSLMTLPISVEDVKREVKILRTLSGHENVVQFYAAFEDDDLVYIVMEICILATQASSGISKLTKTHSSFRFRRFTSS
ncbi:hypothetical protein M758_3G247900 [Ceratodon purpureus]|nr:hypothetical protein M758_3G247900 [Ceratodon purpureus]